MLDIATRDTNHSPAGWLPTSREPLVLRAIGLDGSEQTVRLTGGKSTIGAATVCTVRVPFEGVQPIHCSILRGPRVSVVHCWADRTLLNGESFTDSLLHVGDRLTIGPVEFEILSGVERRADFVAPIDSSSARQLVEKLEQSRQAERRRTRRLLAELRSARWNLTHAQADAARRGDVVQSLETKTAALEAAVAELTAHLTGEQQQLAEARDGWLAERTDLSGELETIRRHVEHEQHRHSADQLQHSLQLQQWETEQQQLQVRLAEATETAQHADVLRQRAADAEAALALAREQLVTVEIRAQQVANELDLERNARELLARDADTARQQLAEAQAVVARLEVELAESQAAVARFEAQLVESQTATSQFESRLAESQSVAARFEAQFTESQRQLEELLQRQSDTVVTIAAPAAVPTIDPAELDQLRQQLLEWELRADDTACRLEATEAERSRLQTLVEQSADRDCKFAELERCAREAADEAARLRQQTVELQHQADELRGRVAELESARAAGERQTVSLEIAPQIQPPQVELLPDQLTEPVVAANAELATVESTVESIANTPIADAPASAADVLARLGRAGIWRDEAATDEQQPPEQPVSETPSAPASLEASRSTPTTPAPTAPPSLSSLDVIPQRERPAGDDESIEDYMARLLKRVRGEQAAKSYKSSGAKADSDAADRLDAPEESAPAEIIPPPAPEMPEPVVAEPDVAAVQYTPRPVPPQFQAKLSAMREIANSSARSAIETHHKSSRQQTSKAKLFVALGIAAGSTIALDISSGELWQYLGIGVGYVTAAFWLSQSLREFFIAKRQLQQFPSPAADVESVSHAQDEAAE